MMKNLNRIPLRGSRQARAQSMVEFALVVPIFLLLVFAIVDFGMGFHAYLTVTNSAREGARLGAVHPPLTVPSSPCYGKSSLDQCIVDRVRETADSLDQSKLGVTVTNSGGASGTSVVVSVDYDYTLVTPLDNFLGMISGDTVGPTLSFLSSADMRLE